MLFKKKTSITLAILHFSNIVVIRGEVSATNKSKIHFNFK